MSEINLPFKFVHFTDTHIVEDDFVELRSLFPNQRARKIIQHINKRHADAAFCLITGDLTHRGQPEQYLKLKEILSDSIPPVYCLVGNHDNRIAFQTTFPNIGADQNGFVQYVIDTPTGKILCLDTLMEGQNIGVYCDQRAAWLHEQLEMSKDTNVFLAFHHPPFDIQLSFLDRMRLMDEEKLWQTIKPHAHRIRHIFMGHVHRTISGNWRGLSYSMLKSTNHQVHLDFKANSFKFNKESPEYAVIQISKDTVSVFNQSIKAE